VKEVINPLRASGGADKEPRDQARKNAPLTVTALDRLISTEDYADFARTFAGISKSVALRLSDGLRELVHLTIAGADDMPIDKSSDLFRNLTEALLQFGDPFQPLKVELRELKFLFVSAQVSILPEYLWDPVVTNVRAKLLDTFSFERRELGQDALLSEVISAIQSVKGVAYVDVDVFGGVPEKKVDGNERRLLTPKEILDEIRTLTGPAERVTVQLAGLEDGVINPAQLAYLTPDVPETLILNQI
jgi:predicted phage baseplate assembly protein